mgnify:CR=1 FL=1
MAPLPIPSALNFFKISVNISPLSAYNTIDNGTVLQKCQNRSGDGGGYDSQSAQVVQEGYGKTGRVNPSDAHHNPVRQNLLRKSYNSCKLLDIL